MPNFVRNFEFLTVGRVTSVELRHVPNFVEIVRTAAEIDVSFNIMLHIFKTFNDLKQDNERLENVQRRKYHYVGLYFYRTDSTDYLTISGFTSLNGLICLHSVLDKAGSQSVFKRT